MIPSFSVGFPTVVPCGIPDNCCGLTAPGHVTSAYDIGLMSACLLREHPWISDYATIWQDTVRGGAFGLGYTDVGCLKEGYSADFQILTGNAAIQLTEKNVVAEVFWRKDPKDIKKVYVNGNLICQDGHSVNLDDERIRKDFSECVREFWKGQPYQD